MPEFVGVYAIHRLFLHRSILLEHEHWLWEPEEFYLLTLADAPHHCDVIEVVILGLLRYGPTSGKGRQSTHDVDPRYQPPTRSASDANYLVEKIAEECVMDDANRRPYKRVRNRADGGRDPFDVQGHLDLIEVPHLRIQPIDIWFAAGINYEVVQTIKNNN